jgi:hypothetical protein
MILVHFLARYYFLTFKIDLFLVLRLTQPYFARNFTGKTHIIIQEVARAQFYRLLRNPSERFDIRSTSVS